MGTVTGRAGIDDASQELLAARQTEQELPLRTVFRRSPPARNRRQRAVGVGEVRLTERSSGAVPGRSDEATG